MSTTVEALLREVAIAHPNTLAMSRAHCHARNLSSVVLANRDGRLRRVFLAWPGHSLTADPPHNGPLTVGIHDHRYAIALTPVFGGLWNHLYAPGDDIEMTAYAFTSGVSNGEPRAEPMGTKRLNYLGARRVHSPVQMPHGQLHTVTCSPCAAWIVEEGVRLQKATALYSNVTPQLRDLYEPIEDVKGHVESWAALAAVVA